jgi:hypothetical protein
MTSNNTPASSASSANSTAAAAAAAAANTNNADGGKRKSRRILEQEQRKRAEGEERGSVRNDVNNEKKADTPSSKNKRATNAAVASVSASVFNTSATTANGDTQSLPSSEAIAKKEEKENENENNSALVQSTPKKKPSPSSVLRPSPIINATGNLKGLTVANDNDAAANDDEMVDKVRGMLGQLFKANFPEQAINVALSVTDNDPNRAAYFLHSKGQSEKTADEAEDPPSKRRMRTRSSTKPESSIKGKSIVSDNESMSSLMTLRQLSLTGPSTIAAVPFGQFVPQKGVHWDDSNKARNKMSMATKSAKGVSVRCGYDHQDNFGEEGFTDAQKRFARALSICEMNEQSQLVQVTPNPFGLNASERSGWFGECADCGKQFQCCHDLSTTEAVQFKYKWFRRHKLQCGREEVCPCGLNAAQIADALRRVNRNCTTSAVEIHMANCIDPCDYIQRIDDYQELVKSLVNGLDASEETKNEFLEKYLGLPNQYGLEAMLKKLGISAEKKKELLKIWPAKVCKRVYKYSSDRLSAKRFATKEMKDALERAGLSVEKVVAA